MKLEILPSLGNKGIYSIITTFFLVVVMMAVIVALIYFNFFIIVQEREIYEELELYEIANDIKKNILACYSAFPPEGTLTPEKVTDSTLGQNCMNQLVRGDKARIKGLRIEELRFLECPGVSNTIGELDNCAPDAERFIFFTTVEEGAISCATRISLCLFRTGGPR